MNFKGVKPLDRIFAGAKRRPLKRRLGPLQLTMPPNSNVTPITIRGILFLGPHTRFSTPTARMFQDTGRYALKAEQGDE